MFASEHPWIRLVCLSQLPSVISYAVRPATRKAGQVSGLPFTILIVDDSAVIRKTLRSCLERNRDWKVCGEADNGKVAVEKVKELCPDVVILDWQMPIMNGIEAAREIARIAPGTTIVMFTMYCYPNLSQDANAVGVRHVFSKSEGPYRMVASLKSQRIDVKPDSPHAIDLRLVNLIHTDTEC